MAGNGAGRRDGGAGEVHLRGRVAHAAHEVAVRGRHGALARRQDAHVAPQARPARGRGDGAVRVDEDVHEALGDALAPHLLGGGDHDAAHARVDRAPAQHLGRRAHVLDAPVGAAADDGLVDRDVARLGNRVGVRGQVRPGHGGLDGGGVDVPDPRVLRPLVGVVLGPRALAAAVEPGSRHVVDLDDARFGARLDRHVAHGEAPLHAQGPNGAAGELHRPVQGPVDADQPDDVQDDILARDAGRQLAVDDELEGFRHFEPGAARRHRHAQVGGANPRGERAERAVGAGVGVGADDQVAGTDDALFGQQRVLDAHAADLPVVLDPLGAGEVAHPLGLPGALDVLVGGVVVGHEAHPRAVEHLGRAQVLEDPDGDGCGDVVGEGDVEVALHELPGAHLGQAGVGGQNLLRHGHGAGHAVSSLAVASGGAARPDGDGGCHP